jgi:hypothetical protein
MLHQVRLSGGATSTATLAGPRVRKVLCVMVAAVGLGSVIAPAAAGAAAEQFVVKLVDEPAPWEFDDPCTGEAVHGVGLESGVVRFTDLGDRGRHVRINVSGVADLYDNEDNFIGTWTYRLRFRDQFPPDAQGAVLLLAVGPLEYADGSTRIIQVLEHEVFGKGDIPKREFFKATCGG